MSALVTLLANIVAPLQRQFINFIRIAICVLHTLCQIVLS